MILVYSRILERLSALSRLLDPQRMSLAILHRLDVQVSVLDAGPVSSAERRYARGAGAIYAPSSSLRFVSE